MRMDTTLKRTPGPYVMLLVDALTMVVLNGRSIESVGVVGWTIVRSKCELIILSKCGNWKDTLLRELRARRIQLKFHDGHQNFKLSYLHLLAHKQP